MKIITSKQVHEDYHNRFIIGSNIAFDIPSVIQIKKGQVSQISKSPDHENLLKLFNSAWENEDSLDIIEEWDKIKNRMDKFGLSPKKPIEGKCTKCGKVTKVPPYIMEKKIPILCPNCR